MSRTPSTHHLVAVGALALGIALGGCTKTPDKLVIDLGDSQTLVREKARTALKELGPEAVPYLLDGLTDGAVRDGAGGVLVEIGDASLEPTVARLDQLCEDEEALDTALHVVTSLATPSDIVEAYVAASREGRCTERALLEEALALEPDKTDVTVNIKENLRYNPARFAYKANPDESASRALARLCLYDEELGWKVSDMNRDKDQEIYFAQWRMQDPLVRANLAAYLTDVIWSGYYDNEIPAIVKEEVKASPDAAATKIGTFATSWRTRLNGPKSVGQLTDAHTAVKAHYAASPGMFDEECLVLHALEEMAAPIRQVLDEKNRKRDIQALDEAIAAVRTDREAACTAASAHAFMPAPATSR